MSSSEYWRRREDEALKHYITDEKQYDKELRRIYENMLDSCQSEINAFYGKYAASEGITLAEAKKRVSTLDIKAYERKAAKYVKEKEFSKTANEEMRLYNATMRINRLEMLKANIGLELIAGHNELEKFMSSILKGRTNAELKRQAGILGKTITNNAQLANSIVNASFHNATFSDRIWQYQDIMKADLSKLIQQGMIAGKNPRALAKDLRKYFIGDETLKNGKNGAVYATERLMRTELARVQTEAQKQSFKRNGFEYFEFITNSGCCPICAALNGKHYKVDKMQVGLNAPPMHPHCRCSTAAWEDDAEYEAWLDYLDKGGTTAEWNKIKEAQLQNGTDKDKKQTEQRKDKFTDAGFKVIEGKHSYIDDLKSTNPKYLDSIDYQINCSHTVPAYEMRRRGYDVIATGAKNDDKYKQAGMRAWGIEHNEAVKTGRAKLVNSKRCDTMTAEIEDVIINAGEGSRFEIRVGWKTGGGHFFVGENINGKAVFIDPQSGEYGDAVRDYFMQSKPSGTWYTRIDNIELDTKIMQDVCEVRK